MVTLSSEIGIYLYPDKDSNLAANLPSSGAQNLSNKKQILHSLLYPPLVALMSSVNRPFHTQQDFRI